MLQHQYSSKCAFSSIDGIRGRRVTVMGLGLNGGGLAAVRFLLKKGALVTVTDMKTEEQLRPSIDALNSDAELDTSRLTYRLGEHRLEDFYNADCVIKNPGVKYDGNKYLAAAKAIETDLSLFLRFTDCPIIAVTGSKGKSSTVSAIYYGLKAAGFKTFLGGNITVSPLTFFDEVSSDTPVVIEFSSWQLSDLRGRGILKPHISIITKIVPDHQNWYGNMEDYVADKRLIYADQTQGDYSIFDAEPDEEGTEPDRTLHPGADSWGSLFADESKATVLRYGKSESAVRKNAFGVWQDTAGDRKTVGKVILPQMNEPEIILRELSVPGRHMRTNALNAALVMYLMGVPAKKTAKILSQWQGLDHRLQFFHQWKNAAGQTYKFYNDSCATVPEAAVAASQAFERSVILMTGGTDKGLDLKPLEELITGNSGAGNLPKAVYLLAGSATDKLADAVKKAAMPVYGPYRCLEDLLLEAKKNLNADSPQQDPAAPEVFVFSPGATSFGMFQNEFDRGQKFMACVKKIFEQGARSL